MTTEWFRNTTWNEEIAAQFDAKLRRARNWNRAEYLRIQAHYLADSHPRVALDLLDRYFREPISGDRCCAFVVQAIAFTTLGDFDAAIHAFEAAISREAEYTGQKSTAHIQYPYFVAAIGISEKYDRALQILNDNQRIFPVEAFMAESSRALIYSARGRIPEANSHAIRALEFAELTRSQFPRHPTVGLVGNRYTDMIERLRKITFKA